MIHNVIQRRTVFAVAMSAVLLAACASPQREAVGPTTAVVGTVDVRERMALPPEAVLVVELQDTSSADAAAKVVSQQSVRLEGLQPPFKYTLPVEASRINPGGQYTVRARITHGNQALFTSDIAYPVLTRGAGKTADLVLMRAVP